MPDYVTYYMPYLNTLISISSLYDKFINIILEFQNIGIGYIREGRS